MNELISEKVFFALEEALTYLSKETEWITVKKQLLKMLPPHERTNFSTRDIKTKKQTPNEMEIAIVQWWFTKTGVRLVM